MAQTQPPGDDRSLLRPTSRRVTRRSEPEHASLPPLTDRSLPVELICASHREPYVPAKNGHGYDRTTGGLTSAMDGALRELGGHWIASGEQDRRFRAPHNGRGRTYDVHQIGLTAQELDQYYAGFSNRVLWPLFHYFIGRVNFQPDEWNGYVRVNRHYAKEIQERLDQQKEPTVAWIHDYHLLLTPGFLREARPDALVGFFLHTPFPAYEVFRILPSRRELLEGMLGADLIGFHTVNYQDAFLDSVRRLLGARVDRNGTVEHRGHRTRTLVAPIGIDVEEWERLASDPRIAARAQRLRKTIVGDSLVLGVDRLDYAKGIPERLAGFERLLQRHPEHRGRVTLVQIAVPSRIRVEEYRELKRLTDETVGSINGHYGDAIWTPVHYITRALQAHDLAAYYRAADVALVTPLRDGLNLVAKEFVASRVHGVGALVLSEFAGVADELPQAYFVNPFGPDSIAEALHTAITDDRIERERRMASLISRVRSNDVGRWARNFVQQLLRSAE